MTNHSWAPDLPGLRRDTLGRNVTAVWGADPYYLVSEPDFDDLGAHQAAFRTDGHAGSL
jgi:hypothetical protein